MKDAFIVIAMLLFTLALIVFTVYATHFWDYSNWLWVLTVLIISGISYKSNDNKTLF